MCFAQDRVLKKERVGLYKNLFFDDQRLFVRDNAVRDYGEPELIEIYNDGVSAPCVESPYVFATDDGKYRMLYQGKISDIEGYSLFIAVSDDGIHFKPEDISEKRELSGALAPHQVMALPDNEIAYIIEDKINDPHERYKLLKTTLDSENIYISDTVMVSDDLIHWKELTDICWHERGTEPCTGVFYNEYRKCFTIITRPVWGDRQVGYVETKDWRTFTDFRLCMQCDSLDAPLEEIYGMPAFSYDGWKIGFTYIYGALENLHGAKFIGGTVKTQLSYSWDGMHWQRSLRTPFLAGDMKTVTERAGVSYNLVWPAYIIRRDGEIFIYAAAATAEHGTAFDGKTRADILVFRLREDGFIRMENGDKTKPAVIATRENAWNGGEVHINIAAEKATVAIYRSEKDAYVGGWSEMLPEYSHENCIPFSGDSTDWIPQFKNGKKLDDLKGQTICIEVKFENGKLYSVSGDCVPLMNTEAAIFRKSGKLPPCEMLYNKE